MFSLKAFCSLQFVHKIGLITINVFSPIFRSRRPGLRRAGSRVSGRLVAMMIFTWEEKERISFDFSCIERNVNNYFQIYNKIDFLHKLLKKYGWHRSLTCPRASKPSIWFSSWVKKHHIVLNVQCFCYKSKQFVWIGGNWKHCYRQGRGCSKAGQRYPPDQSLSSG